ncbi:hypothetical protein Pelo_11729 [Pelomyxa schiedti]|nr:hypothetical protein Pelo_11729 [Pelomyxa schiedti]
MSQLYKLDAHLSLPPLVKFGGNAGKRKVTKCAAKPTETLLSELQCAEFKCLLQAFLSPQPPATLQCGCVNYLPASGNSPTGTLVVVCLRDSELDMDKWVIVCNHVGEFPVGGWDPPKFPEHIGDNPYTCLLGTGLLNSHSQSKKRPEARRICCTPHTTQITREIGSPTQGQDVDYLRYCREFAKEVEEGRWGYGREPDHYSFPDLQGPLETNSRDPTFWSPLFKLRTAWYFGKPYFDHLPGIEIAMMRWLLARSLTLPSYIDNVMKSKLRLTCGEEMPPWYMIFTKNEESQPTSHILVELFFNFLGLVQKQYPQFMSKLVTKQPVSLHFFIVGDYTGTIQLREITVPAKPPWLQPKTPVNFIQRDDNLRASLSDVFQKQWWGRGNSETDVCDCFNDFEPEQQQRFRDCYSAEAYEKLAISGLHSFPKLPSGTDPEYSPESSMLQENLVAQFVVRVCRDAIARTQETGSSEQLWGKVAESALALKYFSSSETVVQSAFVEAGAIDMVAEMITKTIARRPSDSSYCPILEGALHCIWSLCIGNAGNKLKVSSALPVVLQILRQDLPNQVLEVAVMVIWSACYGVPCNQQCVLNSGGIEIMENLMCNKTQPNSSMEHAITGAIWHLSTLVEARLPIAKSKIMARLPVIACNAFNEEEHNNSTESALFAALAIGFITMDLSSAPLVKSCGGIDAIVTFIRGRDHTRYSLHGLVWTTFDPLVQLISSENAPIRLLGVFLVACLSRTTELTAKLFMSGINTKILAYLHAPMESPASVCEVKLNELYTFILANWNISSVSECSKEASVTKNESLERVLTSIGFPPRLIEHVASNGHDLAELPDSLDLTHSQRIILHNAWKTINTNFACSTLTPISMCTICMDSHCTVYFDPCGHRAACEACTHILLASNERCPLCRAKISGFVAPLLPQIDPPAKCILCADSAISCIFVPCGHGLCCTTCSPKLPQCPLCHAPVARTITLL